MKGIVYLSNWDGIFIWVGTKNVYSASRLCYLQCGSCVAVFSVVLLHSCLLPFQETGFIISKTELC